MKEVNSVSDATNIYGEDIKLTTTDASTLYKTIITELEKGAGEPLYPCLLYTSPSPRDA